MIKSTSRQTYVNDHNCLYTDGDNIRALKPDGSHESPAKEIAGSGPKESSKADTDHGKESKSDTKDTVEESDPKPSDETGGDEEKSENSKDDGKTKEEKEEASKKLQELLEIQRKAFLEAKKPDQVIIV